MTADQLFLSVFDSASSSAVTAPQFLLCVCVSLVLGIFLAALFGWKTASSRSFLVTLATLPAVVCVVIMVVNGNVGAGVAVCGAFSLVRFRSAPGTAREICGLFLAMGTGIVAGMGFLAYAVLFAVILGIASAAFESIGRSIDEKKPVQKLLNITIPEDLDYTGAFDDLFEQYTDSCKQVSVKTSGLGSMYKLRYEIVMKDPAREKQFLDEIRCRNGNLETGIARKEITNHEEL